MLPTLISTVLTALLNIFICHSLLTRRKSVTICIYTFILTSMVICTLISLSLVTLGRSPLGKYTYIALSFCYLIYYHIIFEESFAKKLFTMLSIWLLTSVILLVGLYVFDVYIPIYNGTFYTILAAFLRVLIQLGILLFITAYLRSIYRQAIMLIDDNIFYLMFLYTIITALYLVENFDFNANRFLYSSFMGIILLAFLTFSGYAIAYIAISSVIKTLTLKHDFDIIEKQLNLQRDNYCSLNKLIEKHMALKHDIKHHLLAIKSMAETGNLQDAFKHIQQFSNEALQDIPIVCKNLTVDSFVKYYMSIALDKGITLKTNLHIPQDININPIDLCVVLGNGLDNAINACNKLSIGCKKYIELKSNIVGTHIVIKILNSYNGELKKDGDIFLTTFRKGHGIGLSSIFNLARKYKGHVDIKHSPNEFEVNIIMNIESQHTL